MAPPQPPGPRPAANWYGLAFLTLAVLTRVVASWVMTAPESKVAT